MNDKFHDAGLLGINEAVSGSVASHFPQAFSCVFKVFDRFYPERLTIWQHRKNGEGRAHFPSVESGLAMSQQSGCGDRDEVQLTRPLNLPGEHCNTVIC
jgi:hypothetical protein